MSSTIRAQRIRANKMFRALAALETSGEITLTQRLVAQRKLREMVAYYLPR